MRDPIERSDAIDAIDGGAEFIRRTLDDMELVGDERSKFEWGLGLLESCIDDMKNLPSAESEEFEWCTDCKEYDQKSHCCHRFRKVIRNTVEELKSEQQERKTGKWIYKGIGGWHCSECDEQAPFWSMSSTQNLSSFCHNCGADMRGEQDEL